MRYRPKSGKRPSAPSPGKRMASKAAESGPPLGISPTQRGLSRYGGALAIPTLKDMLSHLDENNRPTMVDVGGKVATRREATAQARVSLPPEVRAALADGEIASKKGPVFQTAILAGIMAAKKT